MARQFSNDMTTGSITKHLLAFALPLMVGNIFQLLYNTVDSVVVGNFVGKDALAAVGTVGPIINTIIGFFGGIASGATVVISQYFGAHDEKNVGRAVHTTIALCLICCVLFTGIGVALVPAMLRLMKTPDDVWNAATQYLTIYFGGVTGLILYNIGSGILRAVGDSKRPLYFLIFCALLNTVLDLVFVLVFHMAADGVAYATVISQLVSAVLVMLTLMRSEGPYKLYLRRIRLDVGLTKKIVGIGFPTAIQQSVTSFSNVIVQSYINFFGSACMAGWTCYAKLDQFIVLPVMSIGMANTTFAGQNMGAHDVDRVRQGTSTSMKLGYAASFLLLVPVFIFAPQASMFFNQDPEVVEYGVLFIRWMTPFFLITVVNQILAGTMRGVGDATGPTIIMMASFIAFRQVYLFAVSHIHNTILLIALGYPLGWLLCSVILTVYYRRGIWLKHAVKVV